jgi:cell division protein FtsN
MAARRGKSQATRHSNQATPAWVWLLLGLLVGVAIFFIAPGLLKKDGDGFFRPQPNPDAQPAQADGANVEEVAPESPTPSQQSAATDEAPKETQYDFYTLLPGKEVQMSDAELAASARDEEARRARALLTAGNDTPVAPPATTLPRNPTPVTETPDNRPAPANTPVATTAPVAPTSNPAGEASAATTVASANTGARYILQAGAFGASGDAEAAKAKIALLGLGARVESAQINGKTVYRVRMGPYGTASELADAKQKLANGGLPAMAIKAQ